MVAVPPENSGSWGFDSLVPAQDGRRARLNRMWESLKHAVRRRSAVYPARLARHNRMVVRRSSTRQPPVLRRTAETRAVYPCAPLHFRLAVAEVAEFWANRYWETWLAARCRVYIRGRICIWRLRCWQCATLWRPVWLLRVTSGRGPISGRRVLHASAFPTEARVLREVGSTIATFY